MPEPELIDETLLSGYVKSLEMSIRYLSVLTQTPSHYLLGEIDKLRAALTASDEASERLAAAHGGPCEMAEQIAYKLQTLLDAQHTPIEEIP